MLRAKPHWRRLLLHTAECAADLARESAGNSSAARIAMMALTTRSSIKVKASAQRAFFLCQQPGAKLLVAHFLHRHFVINGDTGGGRGGLAENHEDRLHANRTVSD